MALTITDNMARIMASLKALTATQVLVGIPASNTERKQQGEPADNATLGYVHENGSPARNIPARPFLGPGVEAVQPEIAERMRRAAIGGLTGDSAEVRKQLSAAGQIAASSVKARINSNIAPALSPETIKNRNRSRQTKSMRKGEKDYAGYVKAGISEQDAQDMAGIIALVNTAQLRNSITYVLRKR